MELTYDFIIYNLPKCWKLISTHYVIHTEMKVDSSIIYDCFERLKNESWFKNNWRLTNIHPEAIFEDVESQLIFDFLSQVEKIIPTVKEYKKEIKNVEWYKRNTNNEIAFVLRDVVDRVCELEKNLNLI